MSKKEKPLYVPGELHVLVKENSETHLGQNYDSEKIEKILSIFGVDSVIKLDETIYKVKFSDDTDIDTMKQKLQELPWIEDVEYNYIASTM